MVKTGRFREDLFYRLNVIKIKMPLLRDRPDDIPELCHHFLTVFNRLNNKSVKKYSDAALNKLCAYTWPGNIRELRNVIQHAVIFCGTDVISEDLIQFTTGPSESVPAEKRKTRSPYHLSLTDKSYIIQLLEKHLGRVAEAARELGIGRVTLYKYLKKHEIDINQFKQGFNKRD
jgi:DNA-binding NtrC family response regulator